MIICNKCRVNRRYPWKRWCNACHADYSKAWRKRKVSGNESDS